MLDYTFVTRAEDLPRIANEVVRADVLGVDIETTHLDPRKGVMRLVQLILPGEENSGNGRIYVVDLFETGGLGPVEAALKDSKAIFVIHNAKFEQKWFWWKYRFQFWPVFCTFRASAIIYNGKKELKHDLDSVVIRELNEHPTNTDQGGSDWSGRLTQQQKDYAAEDVLRLLRLRKVLKDKLTQYDLLHPAMIEFGVVLPEGRAELNGFPLNRDKWMALADANVLERRRLKEELLYELPHPKGQIALPGMNGSWNPDSPKQVLASLQRLGLKKLEGTAEMELAQHAGKHPLVRKLLTYRHVAQRVKTFGEKYLRWLEEDGRIHTEYYAMLAAGRYSSSKPNLQQIPRDREFRACFAVPEGRILVLADYSGIEMRICAEISEDAALTRVFHKGEDAHYATASVIMDKHVSQITKKERQNAKPVNFGFIYGMQPDKFVMYAQANYGVTITPTEAKRYHKRYFDNYSGIRSWHRRVIRDGQRTGVSRTLSGRIRYLDPNTSFNEFYNTPIQGTGADALKTAMRLVQERLDKTFGVSPPETPDGPVCMAHHVHDEIILEADDDQEMREAAEKELHDGMYEGMARFLRKVPTVVEPSHGPTWADAK
jgi:DNA polymerase-1